jgi:hypothetical protein
MPPLLRTQLCSRRFPPGLRLDIPRMYARCEGRDRNQRTLTDIRPCHVAARPFCTGLTRWAGDHEPGNSGTSPAPPVHDPEHPLLPLVGLARFVGADPGRAVRGGFGTSGPISEATGRSPDTSTAMVAISCGCQPDSHNLSTELSRCSLRLPAVELMECRRTVPDRCHRFLDAGKAETGTLALSQHRRHYRVCLTIPVPAVVA